ncbi:hypothetical protein FZC78_19075 [Rossellomorea vietnamensis]|uniref:Uncharacterized protein n=1 Tax=Rossellomorea vietnamensis TaxID=218284 RepID=A0A5D4NJR6_9BACI|nr:hypothetical protein [Rossellomorea vietnamensis]TYS14260.1 hypothetical protein FZC78_19075 [Rossellomorea vietnamensis]
MKWNLEAIVETDGVKSMHFDNAYGDKVILGLKLIKRIKSELSYDRFEIIKVMANEDDITEEVKEHDQRGLD